MHMQEEFKTFTNMNYTENNSISRNYYITISRHTIVAGLFALCPFLMNYKIPFTEINITVVLFLGVFAFELPRALMNPERFAMKGFYGKGLFYITSAFIILNHFNVLYNSHPYNYSNTALVNMFLLLAEILGIILFFEDSKSVDLFKKYTGNIAFVMSIIVIAECFIWYTFHIYPTGGNHQLLLPFLDVSSYDNMSTIISPTGLFRPAAFFLEPAHFSRYCAIGLASILFSNPIKVINKKTITITIAMLLTLSGFGMLFVVMIWGLYILVGTEKVSGSKFLRSAAIVIVGAIILSVAYSYSASFRSALARFTGSGGDNAVYGRLGNYYVYVNKLQGFSRTWGMGYRNLPMRTGMNATEYFTGILELLYCQGIVGTAIFMMLYIGMVIKAFFQKNRLIFTVATIAFVFLLGSAFFAPLSVLIYIPFLFSNKEGTKRAVTQKECHEKYN